MKNNLNIKPEVTKRITMRLFFIFIFSFFIVAGAVSCGGREVSRVAGGDGAVFDISPQILASRADTTVWIGNMRAGEVIQYDAWVRNAGTDPLVIIGVDTSCGCTSVEYERKPIAPGEKGNFSFRFDSRGQWGIQYKLIEIQTSAGSRRYNIYVKAEVEE